MKLRTFFTLLAVSVVTLLTLAGGSLYWILSGSPLPLLQGGVMAQPQAAVFVPKQAPVMISLLVNPDRLEAFAKFVASPGNRRKSHHEIEELEISLLSKTGLDYHQQIQPWLGDEITLAVTSLDFDRNPQNGTNPGYFLAVAAKDGELAKEFLQVAYSKQAIAGTADLVFESYKGANLVYQRSRRSTASNKLSASAVVSNFVLFANDPNVLRNALDNVQVADLNLKNATAYQEALNTIVEPRIGVVYANFPALSAWLANLPIPELPEITQTLTTTFSLKSEGLVAQTALIGVKGPNEQPPALSTPVAALNYIPANSLFTVAGSDLAHLWEQIQTGLDPDSPLQQVLNRGITLLQEPFGLNLPQDVFSWVRGEFSLALVPNPNGDQPDWLFVAQKMPEVNVDGILENFDQLARERGYSVGDLPLSDTSVTVWTKLRTTTAKDNATLARLEADVSGVHAQADRYVILATSVEAMSQSLAQSQTPLLNSEQFQQAIRGLSANNDGYLYLNWDQSEPLLQQKFPLIRVAELAVKPLFRNLRSLTFSSQGAENGIRRATAYLNLGIR